MSLPTVLPEADRAVLLARVKAATTTARDLVRARIILTTADHGVRSAARVVGCAISTVTKWRGRYLAHGLADLVDLPRTGAPVTYDDGVRRTLVAAATSDPPQPFATWNHQMLADHLAHLAEPDEHHPTPSRCWVARALAQARIRVHKVTGWLHRKPDPLFDQRVAAIEAAVLDARAGRATVVCIDEKTAVSVRTPIHPDTRAPGGGRRREFEYRRAATLSWYGTQDVATGAVALRRAEDRMDSSAFTMVLDDLVATHGEELTLIMDNGSAHTSKHTARWMSLPLDVTVAFTPVHASWANPVEVIFSILTRQVITGSHHTSADHLDAAAQHWTALRNTTARPVNWSYQRVPRTSDRQH